MKICLIHNYYQQSGGEDAVFASEAALLRLHGHEVIEFTEDNQRIKEMAPVPLALNTIWSRIAQKRLLRILRDKHCDVAHFHNTFPLISPSAYYACKELGIPVVQVLHNYRLLCPVATFFRDGRVCEDCLGKTPPIPGIQHACYHRSRIQTAVIAAMLTFHRWLRTWQECVDIFIALTEFVRMKFIEGGFPGEKLVVKPNFVLPDPRVGDHKEQYALYVGRLAPEKGIQTLLTAWQSLHARIPLKIVGDGPLAEEVVKASQKFPGVEWLGHRSKDRVLSLMKDARVLILPSLWYEAFPVVVVEACAVGLPVIGSDLGSLSTLIDHGRTGLHFRPGDPEDLVAKVDWLLSHPAELASMRREARLEFETKYTAERNYEMLMKIYELAIQKSKERLRNTVEPISPPVT